MTTNQRKRYNREFKEEAVNLKTEFGEEEKDGNPESRAALQMELRRVRMEIKCLREEREILIKAAVFLAKEQQ